MKYCETCRSSYPNDFQVCPKDNVPLRVTSEFLPGLIIREKYQIVEKLGEGGMAVVYRARHLAFSEDRAIKVVKSNLAEDAAFLKRFRAEAIVTRRLQHANAVRVDDLDNTEDGRPFIVMEYVQGRDLRALIQEQGALPPARALPIVRQVAEALAAAHKLGITHRDIKPDNILLAKTPEGELPKVMDFGIAKVREETFGGSEHFTVTKTGVIVGTPHYISPEQALGRTGDAIDGRCDVYSLGVVLYELLIGRVPFESDTPMGVLLLHIQSRPKSPQEARPELHIPPSISAILMKALEKEPVARFQSAEEFASALADPEGWFRKFQKHQRPVEATPTSLHAAVPDPHAMLSYTSVQPAIRDAALATPARPLRTVAARPEPEKRHKWPVFLAVGLLAVAFGAGYFVSRPEPADEARNTPSNPAPPVIQQPVPAPPVAQAQVGTTGVTGRTEAGAQPQILGHTARVAVKPKTPSEVPAPPQPVLDSEVTNNTQRLGERLLKRQVEAVAQSSPAVREGRAKVSEQSGNVLISGQEQDAADLEGLARRIVGIPGVKHMLVRVQSAGGGAPVDIPIEPARRTGRDRKTPEGVPSREEIRQTIVSNFLKTGKTHLEAGQYAAAMRSFETVLKMDPTNREAQLGMQRAEQAQKTEREILRKRR